MAPKKATPAKPALGRKDSKGKDAAAEGAPAKRKKITPREIWNRIKTFVKTPAALYAASIVCAILFLAAMGMIALYALEFGKSARLRKAAKQVSDFMTSRDSKLKKNSTLEKLNAAQSYAEVLSAWAAKINELEQEIHEINSLIVKDWQVHGGNIYLFEHKDMTFEKAVEFCALNKSFLTSIENEPEEEYMEAFVRTRTVSFWIGLHKKGREWVWFEDIPVTVQFWAPNRPLSRGTDCVVIANDCTTGKRCWQDVLCTSRMRTSCKRRPNKKFLN